MASIKTYSELIQLPTFEERLRYLRLGGVVGESTFGSYRYLNQNFYRSREWKQIRDYVFVRDGGCDLGIDGRLIHGQFTVHHMNPIGVDDIVHSSDFLMNPEYLITVTPDTHNAIHVTSEQRIPKDWEPRHPYDTCPWRG